MQELSINALLFCNDAQLLCTVDRVFEDFHIVADVCSSLDSAADALQRKDFDFLAIDLDEPGAAMVMDYWGGRGPSASRLVIAFARRTETMKQVRGQVHFMLQKPMTASLLTRTLRAAQGTLVLKSRSVKRQAVKIDADVHVVDNGIVQPLIRAKLLDLNVGGACMKTASRLVSLTSVRINFLLPATRDSVHAQGTVMWSEPTGVSGIKFTFVPPKEMAKLKAWYENNASESLSAFVNSAGISASREHPSVVEKR